jgi:hypothetical protein
MQRRIKVKSSNNISKWQMGFNSAFKGLNNNQKLRQKSSLTDADYFEDISKI